MNIRILSHIDIILFYKAQDLKYILYNEVTVKVLKSPNELLQDTLLLTSLISLYFKYRVTVIYSPPPQIYYFIIN
jgi:hypothetical protein